MDQWLEEIRAALPELVVYQQEPMKKHTTFRVGGPADLYVCPKKQELPVILGLAKKKGLTVTVIGNGSNLLVGDKGIRGLVIEVGAQMNAVEVQGNILRAQAGALLSQVAAKAAAAGLGGMEFAAGIPGSMGGAVTMNAGAYGGEMKDVIRQVTVLTPECEQKVLSREKLDLSYRHDVSAAFDPNYPSVMEKRNCAYFGKGLVLNKYTGARGKSGSNDANAEYIARLRRIFDDNDVSFQTSELGKVDQGGGGTIAYILANYGMNVIDSGVAVLNMHAPWEIISKVDLYEALHGYVAFLKEA